MLIEKDTLLSSYFKFYFYFNKRSFQKQQAMLIYKKI